MTVQVLAAILNTLWQSAAAAALVWLALKFLPRIDVHVNAATRYVIWWAALAVILLLPVVPRIVETLHPSGQSAPAASRTFVSPPGPRTPVIQEVPVIVTLGDRRAARWPLLLLALWAAVFLYRALQIVRSYFYLRGVKRRASLFSHALPPVARPAKLLLSNEISSPMAVGFLRPAVILPESLPEELEDSELEHVLLHETAHIARYDDWTNLAGRLLGAALALHPIAVWVLRQIEREREMACDDWVVASTGAARPYAASLARMFELRRSRASEAPGLKLASGIFGSGSRAVERIENLLTRGRDFAPRVSRARTVASVPILLTLAAASALTPRWIAFAQQPSESDRPSFEVASLKPGDPVSSRASLLLLPGGRFSTTNASLQMMIGFAYEIGDRRIAGGPNWLDSAKFNIEAKIPVTTPVPPGLKRAASIRLMLQSLLAERFKLVVHRETRYQPVYDLVVDNGGMKMKDSANADPGQSQGINVERPGQVAGVSAPVPFLVNYLSRQLGRSVVDKTGLTGRYDFTLKWTPDPGAISGPRAADNAAPPPATSGLSIFTALRKDLGLKLESATGPAEFLVVDRVEKPDAN